ncbi:uncharacterized protein EAE98_012462 [Botrytis deweyae]|uniref:DNA2/NAM7 helicase-like C-terminal domain-containing protein n=1 Tax=Botrytis deweyae TaxID=2478750 RepID=A0ABQ7I2W0_9HELO|nr:uncharacterized protein EAE98_012462 [Botrytis deweyae]KAF7907967.1 hypothetical protein EAE98_012462 [Botrytis deweyae]
MSFDPKKAREARTEKAVLEAKLASRINKIKSAVNYIVVNTNSDPHCTNYDDAYPSKFEMQSSKSDIERVFGLFRSLDNHQNRYFGTIGKKPDLGKSPRINILRCNPLNEAPYQGIRFVLQRRVDDGFTYLDDCPDEQYIEFRFYADKFTLSYKVIDGTAKDEVQSLTTSTLPDGPLLSVKFLLKSGGFSVTGLNNGAFIDQSDASKLLHDQIHLWKEQGEFEYITTFTPFWLQYFDVTAQMFAKFGQHPGFKQYAQNGLPDGQPKVQWNVAQILKKQNDQSAMFPYPDYYPPTPNFDHWNNFLVRNFYAAAQEHLWINQFCEELRDTGIPSRWFQNSNSTDNFAISVVLPKLKTPRGNILSVESEVFVHFRPRSIDERKPKGDTQGWQAFVEPTNLIRHDGGILLTCTRTFHQNEDDDKYIPADVAPNGTLKPKQPFVEIYLRVVEPETSVKARVRALNEWDPKNDASAPSEEDNNADELSFGQIVMNQLGYGHKPSNRIGNRNALRQVLLGHGVLDSNDFFLQDMVFDLPSEQFDLVFKDATERQTIKLKKFSRHVPMAILPIIGPAGTGKTTMTISFVHCAILANKKTLIVSTTNVATTNIYKRMASRLDSPEYLHVRLHTQNMELTKFRTYDCTKPMTHPDNLGTPTKVYNFEGSLAHRMLQVIGVLSCQGNRVLERLMPRHIQLKDALIVLNEYHNSGEERHTAELSDAQEKFNVLATACAVDILTHCITVSATTIAALTPWLAWFRAVFELLIIDEAGCVPLLEVLLHINPFIRIILVGDTKQFSPYVGTHAMTYTEPPHRRVNTFSDQIGYTLLHNLQANGWPCLFLDEQLRTEPGLSKITSKLVYKGLVSDYHGLKLTALGRSFERFVVQHLRGDMHPYHLTLSPSGEVLPVFVDIRNTFSHKQTFGTSRGNTYTANYAIKLCVDMVTNIPGLLDEDCLIITPYKHQVSLLLTAIEFAGRKFPVSTTDSFQGMEAKVVIFDTVCSASQRRPANPTDVKNSHLHIFDFIADARRFNVGLSRMKSGLIILADSLIFKDMIHTSIWRDTYSMLSQDGRVIAVDGEKIHNWPHPYVHTIGRDEYHTMQAHQTDLQRSRREQVYRQYGDGFSNGRLVRR